MEYYPFPTSGFTPAIVALCVHFIFWTAALIFIEYRDHISCHGSTTTTAPAVEKEEDIDVTAERNRVPSDESRNNDLIRLIGLRKEYLLVMAMVFNVFEFCNISW